MGVVKLKKNWSGVLYVVGPSVTGGSENSVLSSLEILKYLCGNVSPNNTKSKLTLSDNPFLRCIRNIHV